jgi:dienelactone hydrolase
VGPGVIIVHELPGMTPEVIAFADEVAGAGFTVVMPHLFGRPCVPYTSGSIATSFVRVCVSREFNLWGRNKTSPVVGWLRALAKSLHAELGGPGVGALGMCLTGGFALAMMVEESVVAPVVAQPSLPLAIGKQRAADLNLSSADVAAMQARAANGCEIFGVCYRQDRATGTRFTTLEERVGQKFIPLLLEGKGHATLTKDRNPEAVAAVLAFLKAKLQGSSG